MDNDLRDQIIPKGTQKVEQLFYALKEIDQYESIPNSTDNQVVKEAK